MTRSRDRLLLGCNSGGISRADAFGGSLEDEQSTYQAVTVEIAEQRVQVAYMEARLDAALIGDDGLHILQQQHCDAGTYDGTTSH